MAYLMGSFTASKEVVVNLGQMRPTWLLGGLSWLVRQESRSNF